MPSGSYKQVHVGCPFYQYDDGKRTITCEGVTYKSTLTWRFPTKREYEKQMDTFCCQHWECCEVCRMLMEIYED